MFCVDAPATQPTKAAAFVAQARPDAHVKGADAVPANQPHVWSLRNEFPCRGSRCRSSSAPPAAAVGAGGTLLVTGAAEPTVPVSQGIQGAGSSWPLACSQDAPVDVGSSRHAAAVARTAKDRGRLMIPRIQLRVLCRHLCLASPRCLVANGLDKC